MRRLFALVLCAFLQLHCNYMFAQSANTYYFTHIDVRNGISENTIKSITQDAWGFMWFGTKNGLNRYDGINIKQYDVDDYVKSFGNHNVSVLFPDKSGILWVGTDKGVFRFNPKTELFDYFDVKTDQGVGIGNWISQIVSDKDGNIWIISPDEGAFKYDIQHKKLKVFRTAPKEKGFRLNPQCICVRENGEIWLGTAGGGIWHIDDKNGRLQQYAKDKNGYSIRGTNIFVMCDYGDYIAIGEHENNLVKFNTVTHEFSQVNASKVNRKVIRCLLYHEGKLIVGTQEGLFFIDEQKGTEEQIRENSMLPNWISDNSIFSLYLDRSNGLWIGTMCGGVNYLPKNNSDMVCYRPTGMPGALAEKRVRDMLADTDGKVWIASEEGTLSVFDKQSQFFRSVPVTHFGGGTNRLGLMQVGDFIWSGIFKNGLDVINRHSLSVQHFTPQQLNLEEEGTVYTMLQDSSGRIWLGTGCGIYIKGEGMSFAKVKTIPDVYALDMMQSTDGNIWIATIGSGLFCYQPKTGNVKHYEHRADDPHSLSSNDISSITQTEDGNLWLATDRGGLCKYDMGKEWFESYSKADGFPDDVTYKVLEDDEHNLWFGTNHGVVCFNPTTLQVEVFGDNKIMPGNQYNYKSAVKVDSHTFFFGGSEGVMSINPLSVLKRSGGKHVYISNIRVDNKEVKPSQGLLETNCFLSEEIRLPYDFSSISLDISSLDFSEMTGCTYEYMLEGVDKEWQVANNPHDITYTRLQPGRYLFKVRQAGQNGALTNFAIIVRHPWWSTLMAKIIYLLLGLVLAWWIVKSERRRQARRQARREEVFRKEKDKELLQSKINFFTNITHEIRTPLTLINGSVENIEQKTRDNKLWTQDNYLVKNLNSISKNSKRLLHLINQLLDFRKMDQSYSKLSFMNTDIVKCLRDIIERFESVVNASGKTITLGTDTESLIVPVDQEAVVKILSNLLNNANKYSQSFIRVVLDHDTVNTHIIVTNDGEKVPESKAEEIFKPFTRLDESGSTPGTGIGLPLARSLAEAHHGSLSMNTSSPYNEFVLTLPMKQEHVINVADNETPDTTSELNVPLALEDIDVLSLPKHKEYTILVVEDNEEVMQLVVDHLLEVYEVQTASNGKEGLDMVRNNHIDLVVSDVMMPVMDGVEMCQLIKGDIEVNHIPVVMLTAKHTLQNHIEGLRAGADAYIEKPFSFAHLMIQIENLLANRKRERESFLNKPYLPVHGSNVNKVETDFLEKASRLIIDNIQDSSFNVEQLAQEMCMSRSSLHRKIKEMSDLSPIDFMRLIKLKKAAELISEKGYRVNEVCEMIGINSPSYFIKIFQKQFGMTPKEFASGKYNNVDKDK